MKPRPLDVVLLSAIMIGTFVAGLMVGRPSVRQANGQAASTVRLAPIDDGSAAALNRREKILESDCRISEGSTEPGGECDRCLGAAAKTALAMTRTGMTVGDCKADHHVLCNTLPGGHTDCACWARGIVADTEDCQVGSMIFGMQNRPCAAACAAERSPGHAP